MIINKDFKGFHEYRIDQPNLQFLRHDGKPITCYSAAAKIETLALKRFSTFAWFKFWCLDFLAFIPLFKRFQFSKLNHQLMPPLTKKINDFNKAVREYYHCPFGTVKYIEDAQIICLGECHTNSENRKVNTDLVEAFSQINALLLEEYKELDDGPRIEPMQLTYRPHGIELQGWDSMNSFEKLSFYLKLAIGTIGFTIYPAIVLKELIQYLKQESTVLEYLLPIGGAILSFAIFNRHMIHQLETGLRDRNHNMHKSIEKNLNKFRKIFVVAGYAHFTTELPTFSKCNNKQDIEELQDYLKDKKSIILIPRNLSIFSFSEK
ncbi:MAG: hypothetical protein K1000chlam2_00975 [Chlamydiae bacterium]|nr:hypothetical protein [Chlamydiota bacterium]